MKNKILTYQALNTISRIQNMCREFDVEVIASADLLATLRNCQ